MAHEGKQAIKPLTGLTFLANILLCSSALANTLDDYALNYHTSTSISNNNLTIQQQKVLKALLPSLFVLKADNTANINNNNKIINPAIQLESMQLINHTGYSQLIVQLTKKAFYHVYLDKTDSTHQIIYLALSDVKTADFFTVPLVTGSFIKAITIEQKTYPDTVCLIKIFVTPSTQLQGLRIAGDSPTSIVLDIGVDLLKNTPSGPYQVFIKEVKPILSEKLEKSEKKALTLLRQHHPKQALEILKATNIFQSTYDYVLLAEAYRQLNQPKQALEIYQALLPMMPENAVLWSGIGMCFDALGDHASATKAYLKANITTDLTPALKNYLKDEITHDKTV